MSPKIADFVIMPTTLSADAVVSLILEAKRKKPQIRLWTSSRVLQQFGVPWRAPENRPLLQRLDRMLHQLAGRGTLIRRPRKQTSRNMREEWAYVVSQISAND